jgi:hypothetical protein
VRPVAPLSAGLTRAAGLQQLHLDVRFVAAAAGEYCDPAAQEALNDVMEQAVRMFCQLSHTTPRAALQPDEWFVQRVQAALDSLSAGIPPAAALAAPLAPAPEQPAAAPAPRAAAAAAAAVRLGARGLGARA